jgi:hypothetical protein
VSEPTIGTRRRLTGTYSDDALVEDLAAAIVEERLAVVDLDGIACGAVAVTPEDAASAVLDALDAVGLYPDWDARRGAVPNQDAPAGTERPSGRGDAGGGHQRIIAFTVGPEIHRPARRDPAVDWLGCREERCAWMDAIEDAIREHDAWALLCTRSDGRVTLRDVLSDDVLWDATAAATVRLLTARETPHQTPTGDIPSDRFDRDAAALAWARAKVEHVIGGVNHFRRLVGQTGRPADQALLLRYVDWLRRDFQHGGEHLAAFDARHAQETE